MMTRQGMSRRAFLMGMLGVAAAPTAGAAPTRTPAGACVRAAPARALGLRPDPVRDRSAAFAQAVRQAAERGVALRLPAGDVIVGDVELDVPVHIVGEKGARLVCAPGARRLLRARGADARIEGVRVEGARQRPTDPREDALGLLSFEDMRAVHVRDCVIVGAGGNGLTLERCGGVVVEGSAIRRAAEAAIFALDCQGARIVRNDIAHCGNGGILVWQSEKRHDGALVAMNHIRAIRADNGGSGQNGNGINVFRAGGVRVVDNDIAGCAFSAVRNNSGDEVVIARNLCRRSGEVAIFVEFAFFKALVASNLVEGAAAGISVTNMREGGRLATVTGNIVRDVAPVRGNEGEEGYGIAAEADTAVTGNVVERAAKYGLALGWGPYLRNVTASGNVVRECPVGVAVSVVQGAGAAVITGNAFEHVRQAVVGYEHTRRVTGDLVGARQRPRNVMLSGNVVKRG